jgi:hypothetical protein
MCWIISSINLLHGHGCGMEDQRKICSRSMPAPLIQIHVEALLRLSSLSHLYSHFSSFNNCCCGSGRPGLAGFLFSSRRGDERGWGCLPCWYGSGARRGSSGIATWSTSSVALRRSQAVPPPTHIAEGRLLRALLLACMRHLFSTSWPTYHKGGPSSALARRFRTYVVFA